MNLFIILSIFRITISTPILEEFIFRLWIKKGSFLNKVSFLIFIFDILYLVPRYLLNIRMIDLEIFNYLTYFIELDYTKPSINTFFDFRNAFTGYYIYTLVIPIAIVLSKLGFVSKIYEYVIQNINTYFLFLVTTLVFSLSHSDRLINVFSDRVISDIIYQIIFLAIGGIVFALVRLKYGFRYSVLLHIFINSASLVLFNLL